jgi:hypothetical protein
MTPIRGVSRSLLLAGALAMIANGCLAPDTCARERGEHAGARSKAHSRTLPSTWPGVPSSLRYLGGTGYAPHGWFGYDPTRSFYGWTDACFGVAGRGYQCTYHSEIGTQREPIPLHW